MIQRRVAAGIVFAVIASALVGCGFESPDVQATEHASVQAAEFSVNAIRVRDAFVTAPTGSQSSGSTTTYLVVTFVNDSQTADRLTGITTSMGTASIAPEGTASLNPGRTTDDLVIPPKGIPVEVDTPAANPSGPTIVLTTTTPPQLGTFVPMSFTFASGSSPTEQVPVVPAGETTQAAQPVPTATASVPSPVGVSAST